MSNRLETDEEQDALVSLELVTEHLPRVVANVHHWKWVILGLHSSLQGFMVLALQGTNALNVLTDKSAKAWMENYEKKGTNHPELKLDEFPNLYKKIKSDRMEMYAESRQFIPSGTQDDSFNRLKSLRNDFIHFVPKAWLIDVSGLPHIVIDIISIIEFLAFECGNIFWHEESTKERARALCLLIRQQAEVLHSHYSG